jgi:hypothetical protein
VSSSSSLMVEAADAAMGLDIGDTRRAQFHGTRHRRILLDPKMRPVRVVVREVLAEQPAQMLVVENDGVIEQVAPHRSHEALGYSVLPGALVARTPDGKGLWDSFLPLRRGLSGTGSTRPPPHDVLELAFDNRPRTGGRDAVHPFAHDALAEAARQLELGQGSE